MTVFIVLLVILFLMIKPEANETKNTLIRSFCSPISPTILSNFINNRNITFAEIRRQLSSSNVNKIVTYARAHSLANGDVVFGAAQCRNYLSTAQCVACFDASVSQLLNCTASNGAFIFFDNCFLRYEESNDFYNAPNMVEYGVLTPFGICGNQSASQPTSNFQQAVDTLLSDIVKTTPKTPNFYVASTRQITSENASVYALGQCVENTTQSICQKCIDSAYTNLYNCLPNIEGKFIDMGCFMRYSGTPFFNVNQTIDITSLLSGRSRYKVAIICGTTGGVALFFLILVLWLWCRPSKNAKKTEQAELKGSMKYNYENMKLATNNFCKENRIGKGGFGEVFKAILEDKDVVAVKKHKLWHARAKEEFENEVKLIIDIRHRNLLSLLGWSSEGSDLLLVMEYMPNGSLDRFLWGAKKGTLDWSQRYEIIFGVARGLSHLHNEFHVKIIHRDIKSSNILLGDDLKPKIADFGLARFQPENQTHVFTRFAGTLGYTAPEYALHGLLSDKVDTYSFGIVILEIISGQKSTKVKTEGTFNGFLLENAWKLYEKKMHKNLIDETMKLKQHEQEHAMKMVEIALLCTQSPVSNRPTVSEVFFMLQDDQSLGNIQLTRPTFANNDDRRIRME